MEFEVVSSSPQAHIHRIAIVLDFVSSGQEIAKKKMRRERISSSLSIVGFFSLHFVVAVVLANNETDLTIYFSSKPFNQLKVLKSSNMGFFSF